jgi:thiopeptide-type bacteriocin biosynthesis protein
MPTAIDLMPAGFFVLRTPLLPFGDWLQWTSASSEIDSNDSSERLAYDMKLRRAQLERILSDPVILQALYLTSSDLYRAVETWKKDPATKSGQSVESSLVAFFSRICARPIPFGLSAGISLGRTNNQKKSRLVLSSRSSYSTRTRLDIRYLKKLKELTLQAVDDISQIMFTPNSTIHVLADKVRYLEPSSRGQGALHSYQAVVCDLTSGLDAVLRLGRKKLPAQAILHGIVSPDDDMEDAQSFIRQLIREQILVSELEPLIVGRDPDIEFLHQLKALKIPGQFTQVFGEILDDVSRIDRGGIGAPIANYESVLGKAQCIDANAGDKAEVLHVDLIKPSSECVLGAEVMQEIMAGVRVLCLAGDTMSSFLGGFGEQFRDRFGDREVPLLQALDGEVGISVDPTANQGSSELIRDLPLRRMDLPSDPSTQRDRTLLKLVASAIATGKDEIKLEEDQLQTIEQGSVGSLPAAVTVLVTILAKSQQALDNGNFRILLGGCTMSASLLARFCYLDPVLTEYVRTMLRHEQEMLPDAILADIVHQPAGEKLGNVLCRPHLLDFEIPVDGRSDLPPEQQILLSDLTVSVNASGEIIVRSKARGKQVVPRLLNAHTFAAKTNMPIYRFLCALQFQGIKSTFRWSWGHLFESFPYLPRITIGRLILARARWHVPADEIAGLREGDLRARWARTQAWRIQRKLPRFAFLMRGDQQLPIDLENPLSVNILCKSVEKSKQAMLCEMLEIADGLSVSGPEGHFHHEAAVPFLIRSAPKRSVNGYSTSSNENADYTFPPGSSWLYVQVYCSPHTADRILVERVAPLLKEFEAEKIMRRWFFIRFDDPAHHLRLRIHCDDDSAVSRLFAKLATATRELVRAEWATSVRFDTYMREVDRYGGIYGVECAEKLFNVDSEYVLETLNLTARNDAHEPRWLSAIRSVNALLTDFNFTCAEKREIMGRLRERYRREFDADAVTRHKISRLFLERRNAILKALHPSDESRPKALEKRSERNVEIVDNIKRGINQGRVTRPIIELIESYVHLHVNRILSRDQREHELVLYDFLYRAYDSWIKRLEPTSASVGVQ